MDYSLEAEIWKEAQIQLGEHGFAQVIERAANIDAEALGKQRASASKFTLNEAPHCRPAS